MSSGKKRETWLKRGVLHNRKGWKNNLHFSIPKAFGESIAMSAGTKKSGSKMKSAVRKGDKSKSNCEKTRQKMKRARD